MRIFPFFMASRWDFSTAVTRERKMNCLCRLWMLPRAPCGKVKSIPRALLCFQRFQPRVLGVLLLCESAIAKELQNNGSTKRDSSEATLTQEGFGSLTGKRHSKVKSFFFEDFWGQKLCLFCSVSAGSRQIITGNCPNLPFFLLWCNQEQESLGWLCVGAGTAEQTLKSAGRKSRAGTQEESGPCCSHQFSVGLAVLKIGIKAI